MVDVSVIMPCKNSETTIGRAIDSVLEQCGVSLELLVIDDGSVDSTVGMVERYVKHDSRVKLLVNSLGSGVSSARNCGIGVAVGRYICFLDSDDYLLPDSLRTRVFVLKRSACVLVYGAYYRLLPSGEFANVKAPPRVTHRDLLRANFIGNLTGMYDTCVLGKVFQLNIPHEDYLMWYTILKAGGTARSCGDQPLGVYRVSKSSLSANKFRATLWHWRVLVDGIGLTPLVALYYQCIYIFFAIRVRVNDSFGRISA